MVLIQVTLKSNTLNLTFKLIIVLLQKFEGHIIYLELGLDPKCLKFVLSWRIQEQLHYIYFNRLTNG